MMPVQTIPVGNAGIFSQSYSIRSNGEDVRNVVNYFIDRFSIGNIIG